MENGSYNIKPPIEETRAETKGVCKGPAAASNTVIPGVAAAVVSNTVVSNRAINYKPQLTPVSPAQTNISAYDNNQAGHTCWNHLGSTKFKLKLLRAFVNTCLLLIRWFYNSPLNVISAVKSTTRIINGETIDNAQLWWTWFHSSSWAAFIILQFLPNVLIIVSIYMVIPSIVPYPSMFEHLTVSGAQMAALLKMVCFFLVNLALLRALVESSLESAYKIWWYSSGASRILILGNKIVSNVVACTMELYSWLYRTSFIFMILVLFWLLCYRPILWLQYFAEVFQIGGILIIIIVLQALVHGEGFSLEEAS
ncbi:hypothetical protein NE237_029206 [Protea cynaroides]|uniref:Uncharacterized protein n=1 Tax=Protea cynaroides TaxID=273540 RepID=A0A9Q0GVD7_9MAGN|nr:hypothetical protein NE237_029206 [Protea cynaroides]